MRRYNKNLGDFGEGMAESFLKEKGFTILERNYRKNTGEIDIVAENDGFLVFVEVKTRRDNSCGLPAEAVDVKKQTHLYKTAERYIQENPTEKEIRFDVIEVYARIVDGNPVVESINHIENIVLEVM